MNYQDICLNTTSRESLVIITFELKPFKHVILSIANYANKNIVRGFKGNKTLSGPSRCESKKVVIAEFTSKQILHFPLQSRVVANMMLSSCIFSTRNASREQCFERQWYRRSGDTTERVYIFYNYQ